MSFIILAHKRSGSMMLTSFLNSHPKIVCDDENYDTEVWERGLEAEENGEVSFLLERSYMPDEKLWKREYVRGF